MDRNNMRSSYVNSGTRSLPHMGKRHNSSHSHSHSHSGPAHSHSNHNSNYNGNGHRLSPPSQLHISHFHNNNNNNNQNTQHDDLINYIYDSWNKVTRDLERGDDEAKYYHDVMTPRHLANFRPFNLDEWWARQTHNRNKHRS
ncbi:GATA zinc finger domain-containing protein 14-like isoform X3 [Bombyx mandarina]|uniref:Uncharacterized protein n=2 Tax=Bombyx TaxID=7090 RepID=A0A8R1WPC4_BOMMO|nr:GATA zinc finger domain-containing protein 14 isoform X2 [Bombyx mori]XP_028027985.1 GATA zinc finger domain-containing protein 14-like isoform X2 [Bombyx mandarina]XP_028027986.1 GATA zinc finger domain-containing protein 14-like isoform X3 [Bombyx mandarina]